MKMIYNEKKEAIKQLVVLIIKKLGGKIRSDHLMTLIYLADRKYMDLCFDSITGCEYTMNVNTLSSGFYSLIRNPTQFFQRIGEEEVWFLRAKSDPGVGELCDAAIKVVDDLITEVGMLSPDDLIKYFHTLPEVQNCKKGDIISNEEIFKALGKDQEGIDHFAREEQLYQERDNERKLLSLLEPNWDGNGAEPIGEKLIKKCIDMIRKMKYQMWVSFAGMDRIKLGYCKVRGHYLEFLIFENKIIYLEEYEDRSDIKKEIFEEEVYTLSEKYFSTYPN